MLLLTRGVNKQQKTKKVSCGEIEKTTLTLFCANIVSYFYGDKSYCSLCMLIHISLLFSTAKASCGEIEQKIPDLTLCQQSAILHGDKSLFKIICIIIIRHRLSVQTSRSVNEIKAHI